MWLDRGKFTIHGASQEKYGSQLSAVTCSSPAVASSEAGPSASVVVTTDAEA